MHRVTPVKRIVRLDLVRETQAVFGHLGAVKVVLETDLFHEQRGRLHQRLTDVWPLLVFRAWTQHDYSQGGQLLLEIGCGHQPSHARADDHHIDVLHSVFLYSTIH